MRQKITCPETAHLEEIEYCEDPVTGKILGVTKCTRFHPEDSVDCDGLCAKRLNDRMLAEIGRNGDAREDPTNDDATDDSNDSLSPRVTEILPSAPIS